jgi:L-threonylcarbamoyladenylate synthase
MNWPDDIAQLKDLLERDGLLLLPTDSIWGLCCHGLRPAAILRVLRLKQLKPGQGLVSLVSDLEMLKRYTGPLHPRLETLLALHRRPLTVLYADAADFPEASAGPSGKWAIRITTDPFLRNLISELDAPLVASIPALPGEEAPTHFGVISSQFLENVDYVARWRRNDKTPAEVSVMVELDEFNDLVFLRN